MLRSAVLQDSGIGILPTYFVGEALRQGRLVRVLPQLDPETLGIHAILLSRQHQPLAVRLLLDSLPSALAVQRRYGTVSCLYLPERREHSQSERCG